MPPTFGNGKICYVEIPAKEIARSAAFYEKVFGWRIRTRGDGEVAFDDGVGEVSGSWRLDRAPATIPGFMIHIMVIDAEATLQLALANGAELVHAITADPPEITAHILDPGGNLISIYQERSLRK
jgi:predicted enzyme related to lactoylglutathione lyase